MSYYIKSKLLYTRQNTEYIKIIKTLGTDTSILISIVTKPL